MDRGGSTDIETEAHALSAECAGPLLPVCGIGRCQTERGSQTSGRFEGGEGGCTHAGTEERERSASLLSPSLASARLTSSSISSSPNHVQPLQLADQGEPCLSLLLSHPADALSLQARIDKALIDKEQGRARSLPVSSLIVTYPALTLSPSSKGNAACESHLKLQRGRPSSDDPDGDRSPATVKAGNNSKALALYHSVLLNLKGINNTERLPPVQILPPRQRVGTASPQPSSTQVARDIEGPRIVAVEEESAAAAADAHVKVDNRGKETAANAASDDKNGGARDPSKHEQDDANDDDDDDGSSSEGSTDSNDSEEAIKPETLHTDLKKTMAVVYVNMSMVHAKNGNWVRCTATASE